MTELERQLTQLGRELDWPPTPHLSSSVRRGLASKPSRARPVTFRRSLVIALASLLVLAGGVLAAVPSVRDSVLELIGLQGATVERREQLPPAPELRPLRLGERTTLAGARATIGFEPLVPRGLGRPDRVFASERVPGGELSLAYAARAGLPDTRSTGLGLLVSEFRGDLAPEYFGKTAGGATHVERLTIEGNRAIWLTGAPHFFFYRPPGRGFEDHELRIAENVLLLERGNLLIRLEGAFGRRRALELALSLR